MAACSPYDSPKALLEYATVALFTVDMVFKFRLAFYEDELLVDDVRSIAVRYFKCVPATVAEEFQAMSGACW